MRLDKAVVDRGLAVSRTEAQTLIAAGKVRVDARQAERASLNVTDASLIEVIRDSGSRFVSRAGHKLAAALDSFAVTVNGRRCLDLGASTGGFTDCLLQRGAARVVAVDVGHGQLVQSIQNDPRVESREGVNARYLTPNDFDGEPFALVVGDLSFISLTLVLPAISSLVANAGDCILLVKPQFEVGAGNLGKNGIVRDEARRLEAVNKVSLTGAALGLIERGRIVSPITGGDGNIEYLLWFSRQEPQSPP